MRSFAAIILFETDGFLNSAAKGCRAAPSELSLNVATRHKEAPLTDQKMSRCCPTARLSFCAALEPNLQNFVKCTYENVTRELRIVS